jgi:hypothetical protein
VGIKSRLAGRYDETVIDPPAKHADREIASVVIEQHAPNASCIVALPARHDDVRLKIRTLWQSEGVKIEFPLGNGNNRHDFSRLSQEPSELENSHASMEL